MRAPTLTGFGFEAPGENLCWPHGARGHDFSNCKQFTTLMWQECAVVSVNNSPTTSKVETLLSGSFVLPGSRMEYRFFKFNEGLFDA